MGLNQLEVEVERRECLNLECNTIFWAPVINGVPFAMCESCLEKTLKEEPGFDGEDFATMKELYDKAAMKVN